MLCIWLWIEWNEPHTSTGQLINELGFLSTNFFYRLFLALVIVLPKLFFQSQPEVRTQTSRIPVSTRTLRPCRSRRRPNRGCGRLAWTPTSARTPSPLSSDETNISSGYGSTPNTCSSERVPLAGTLTVPELTLSAYSFATKRINVGLKKWHICWKSIELSAAFA